MSDEQLLIKYRKYKRKRLFIILISILISLLIILLISKDIFFVKKEASSHEYNYQKKEIDSSPPQIYLKTKQIEIEQGDEIFYTQYIEKIIDNVDDNLMESVKYTTIDSSKIGEHIVVYSVVDSSNNLSQEFLTIVVKEKQIQQEVEQKKETITTKKQEITTEQKNIDIPEVKQEKIIKYFLFKDGYTMMNVAEECSKELKKLNRKGMCSPIQDENGIYLGMKLETD